jgi:hypothetical protein
MLPPSPRSLSECHCVNMKGHVRPPFIEGCRCRFLLKGNGKLFSSWDRRNQLLFHPPPLNNPTQWITRRVRVVSGDRVVAARNGAGTTRTTGRPHTPELVDPARKNPLMTLAKPRPRRQGAVSATMQSSRVAEPTKYPKHHSCSISEFILRIAN